jgi:hypothetical protein
MEPGLPSGFERRRFFAVVRKSDGRTIAFCEDVVDAARIVVRASWQGLVEIREAQVVFEATLGPRQLGTF